MLIHIRPRCLSPYPNVALVDLRIQELDLHLIGGTDLDSRRPYPNKRYVVACRKVGRKAIDGILVETAKPVSAFTVEARWALEAEHVATHTVRYEVLDQDFDAVSDHMLLWGATSASLGGWTNRWPETVKGPQVYAAPVLKILAGAHEPLAEQKQLLRTLNPSGTLVAAQQERFILPSLEPERILQSRVWERTPKLEQAFLVS